MPALQQREDSMTLEQYEHLPEDLRVEIFEGDLLSVTYSFSATIKVNIYEDLYIDFSQIDQIL